MVASKINIQKNKGSISNQKISGLPVVFGYLDRDTVYERSGEQFSENVISKTLSWVLLSIISPADISCDAVKFDRIKSFPSLWSQFIMLRNRKYCKKSLTDKVPFPVFLQLPI